MQTNIDLELLFAKMEIDRLEEYISNLGLDERTKPYKDMIIDLSEKYNINSKYTSFLTIYERENKIIGIPEYQETTLSDGITTVCTEEFCIDSLDISDRVYKSFKLKNPRTIDSLGIPNIEFSINPHTTDYGLKVQNNSLSYLQINEQELTNNMENIIREINKEDSSFRITTSDLDHFMVCIPARNKNIIRLLYSSKDCKEKNLKEISEIFNISEDEIKSIEKESVLEHFGPKILKERIIEYYNVFMSQDNKDIITYILFALYFDNNKVFDYKSLVKYLYDKKDQIINNTEIQDLLYLLSKHIEKFYISFSFNEKENKDIKTLFLKCLSSSVIKVLYTNARYYVNRNKIKLSDIEDILKNDKVVENIDSILWYFCDFGDFFDELISEDDIPF